MALRRVLCRHSLSKINPLCVIVKREAHGSTEEVTEERKYRFDGFQPHHYAFLNQDINWKIFVHKAKLKTFEALKENQKWKKERHDKLGPELAAAHFIVGRGGAVKLLDRNRWIRRDHTGSYTLPRWMMDNMFVEGIDASYTDLLYEGLENLEGLSELKFLNLSNCKYIDDFCLSKLQMFGDTLEVLDVSGCERVTENGIACVHHLPNLKVLNIADTPNVKQKEILTIYIEELLPQCIIRGVDHVSISQGDTDSLVHEEMSSVLDTNKFIEDLVRNEDVTTEELFKEAIEKDHTQSLESDRISNDFDSKLSHSEMDKVKITS
ncbi:Distal membrane-arm assembly complex protein 2 [Mytilus coruscus]|uniref:ATP synthase subunit s-like protein n=1 Tax=Mytilus coruscus TaxID=42192 RepID=A0A6J8EKG7_MYTCO|nr:Distal membrane-arm assembly complex protein 2 [Mytilus coruscus]